MLFKSIFYTVKNIKLCQLCNYLFTIKLVAVVRRMSTQKKAFFSFVSQNCFAPLKINLKGESSVILISIGVFSTFNSKRDA